MLNGSKWLGAVLTKPKENQALRITKILDNSSVGYQKSYQWNDNSARSGISVR